MKFILLILCFYEIILNEQNNNTKKKFKKPLVVIKGAGDIATGIALRLKKSKFLVIMTDLPHPTAIRRTVSFCQAIIDGEYKVEDEKAVHAKNIKEAYDLLEKGVIPVFADEKASIIEEIHPDILVDAILAKKNLGTTKNDAPLVIGVGPGFTAGKDCHAVVETKRGHFLGRVILEGSALPNTGIPGNIEGYTIERIIRSPKKGIFHPIHQIGDRVNKNEIVAYVDNEPVYCSIAGMLRGILPDNTPVYKGMKSGDVDPRFELKHCFTASDKALSVGGGVLEACLRLSEL